MPEIGPSVVPTLGSIFFLLMLSAFFSGSETALTATSRARMHKLESDGNQRARNVNLLISDRERMIGAILLGNNLVNILASALATSVFLEIFGQSGIAFATFTMTLLVLIFAEVMPKTLAIARPEGFAMRVAGLMRGVVFVFAPLTRIVQLIVRGSLRVVGIDVSGNPSSFSSADEIRGAIELHHSEGRVDKEARDLIRGALALDEIRLEEVMIHRKSIEMLDLDRPLEALIQQSLESVHTRLPLYREDTEQIIGILHAKDLARALWDSKGDTSALDLEKIARAPYYAPETNTLQEQLDAFQSNQEHFALVVDEYGSLMGLVTLEDILEEIVGEIEDEYDSPVQGVRLQSDGSYHLDGHVTIRDLNRALDINLPDDEAVTVAGLVIHEAQCIPEVGQTFSFHGFCFNILRRRRNQITTLKMSRLASSDDEAQITAE